MKKMLLLLTIPCFSLLVAQKEELYNEVYFPVKYVLKNSKDTIQTKVLNIGYYTNEEFSPATYIRQMTVLDPSGKKLKVAENSIQYMEITDLKNVKRKFFDANPIISKDLGLLQEMYNGKKNDLVQKKCLFGIYLYL